MSPSQINKKNAARFKKFREELSLSMRALAKKWDMDHSTISRWESAKDPIPGPVMELVELHEKNPKLYKENKKSLTRDLDDRS
ncbi:MAG: helix-turn-helix domain-containing protein [Bacteriovoracia bacterium]